MSGTVDHEEKLKKGWETFCDELKSAGDLLFRPEAPRNPVDRAGAFRLLSRNIALALAFELENKDPLFPELLHYFDPNRKQGGDNPDALYVGAPINGSDTYRISGHRGSADFFAVTVVERGGTPWGGAVAGTLFAEDLEVREDGTFELLLGPDPMPGNWMKTTPETFRVTVRQFFSDWEGEEPMRARIDRIGQAGSAPELSPERVSDGLVRSAQWLKESITYWADMIEKWKAQPNRFLSYRQLDDNPIDATPGGEPLICYWQVPEDEALIVRVFPPRARYWSVEFGNYWWESMDYRYRLANTNDHYAKREADGELILVVSHEDPGVPNWLDASGHSEGYVTVRWIGADSIPVPECEQVKFEERFASLPENVRRFDPAQRPEQLAERRRGVARRFPY
jgi:hypothetical protein